MTDDIGDNMPSLSEDEAVKEHTEFFKEMYWREMDRTDKIRSRLTLPITIVTLFCGVVLYYWKCLNDYQSQTITILQVWLLISWVCVAAFTSISMGYLIRCFVGSLPYKGLPYSSDIEKYIKETFNYYYKSDTINIGEVANDTKNYLIKGYIKAASENAWNNDKMALWIDKANKFIALACVGISFGFLPFLILSSENTKKAEIGNRGGQIYATESTTAKTTNPTITTTGTTTTKTQNTTIKDNKRGAKTSKEIKHK